MVSPKMVRVLYVEGQAFERRPGGKLVPLEDKTNYERLDKMTDEEIEAIANSDTDGPPMSDGEWAQAKIRQPRKVPVGLKLDDDVLLWFKGRGRGYQTRINAVLRLYIEAQRKAG